MGAAREEGYGSEGVTRGSFIILLLLCLLVTLLPSYVFLFYIFGCPETRKGDVLAQGPAADQHMI